MGAQAPRLANDRRLRHPPPMRLREKNVRPRVLRTGNYSTPVLSEICLPVEHLPAGIRWPAARLCRNVCTSSYFCRSRPPLPLTVLGTATMDLSTSQFNVGEQGNVLDGCASHLPGSPGGCGVVEPSGRPPSLSGRGLCGGCPTSTLLYFCIPPTVPPQCDKRHKSETEEE